VKLLPISRDTLTDGNALTRTKLIVDRVREAGIEGLGGAKFPTATKLSRAQGATALLVNGMQSEPDNKSDVALLREDPISTLAGISLAALVCPAATLTVALPAGLDKALSTEVHSTLQAELDWLNEIDERTRDARQVYLQPDHASGEEHRLASLLGLTEVAETPSTQPLTELGVLCLNLATCYAIARAVYQGEPLTQRIVTVNGEARWIEFGTPVAQLLDPAWINGCHGGAENVDHKVDAGTFCISFPAPTPNAPCINCAACRPVCPANLAPDELHKAALRGSVASHLRLADCIECGACNAACPSGLHLTQQFRDAKNSAKKARLLEAVAAKANARVKARTLRQRRDRDEREEQRKERVQARTKSENRAW